MAEKIDQLTLFRGWLDRGCYVWSPFVTKVEFRLRVADLSYTVEAGSLMKAPKGKIPYIEVNSIEDGFLKIGDSTLIIKQLTELDLIEDLNLNLSPSDKVCDLAIRAMLEDKVYFYHVRERWIENYYVHRDKILCSIPYPVRLVVGLLIYRKNEQMLQGQGTGRFTAEEIRGFRRQIWESINDLLVSNPHRSPQDDPFWCLGGRQPTEADATVFAFINSVLVSKSCPESQELVRSFPTILDYANRIHVRYFPDYERWE